MNTLTPVQQILFKSWAQGTGAPISDDYDMESYFKDVVLSGDDQTGTSAFDGMRHYPDTYKLPNHPTFSMESQNWQPGMPRRKWIGDKLIDIDTGETVSDETPTSGPFDVRRILQNQW